MGEYGRSDPPRIEYVWTVRQSRIATQETNSGDLICVACDSDGTWEALCLNFDIAVQADSLQEAREALEDAIFDYVTAAHEEDAETRDRLLNRRSPVL